MFEERRAIEADMVQNQGTSLHLILIGADEALEKLDALNAKLKECKGLIEEIGQIELKLGTPNEPPEDA